jgi:hypothetical protein
MIAFFFGTNRQWSGLQPNLESVPWWLVKRGGLQIERQ